VFPIDCARWIRELVEAKVFIRDAARGLVIHDLATYLARTRVIMRTLAVYVPWIELPRRHSVNIVDLALT
jgi:hypothetical protein